MRYLLFSILVLLFGCGEKQASRPVSTPSATTSKTDSQGKTGPSKSAAGVPTHAMDVLSFVRDHGQAPDGFVGGRTFQNREKQLPQKTAAGQKISYREWDVHEKIPGQNRGAERLVTGSDGSAWYTKDHYQTFLRIE